MLISEILQVNFLYILRASYINSVFSTHQVPYTPSSVVHMLLREPKALGTLTHIHIWHDNKGKGENRSWYLDQIVVQEVRTGKRLVFFQNQWQLCYR